MTPVNGMLQRTELLLYLVTLLSDAKVKYV